LYRLAIRDVRASELERAAEKGELLGLTNSNQLAAVLVPLPPDWIDQIIADNMSRVAASIRLGGSEALSEDSVPSLDSLPFTRLGAGPPLRRVPIRELTGELLDELAEQGRTVAVTVGGRLAGVLIPITAHWVDQLVQSNLRRIMQSAQLATEEAASGDVSALGDDAAIMAAETGR
jgi:antitoxin (DNA-binding transcriptional repressor) of toxin-antitoxin stability system